jgi:DNA ligase (NAD+)
VAGKNPFTHNPKTKFKKAKNLKKSEAREQVGQLREALEYHNHLYYIKNKPEISDKAYDALFSRLQELEEAFPELQTPSSPTRRVGAPPLDELKKVEHRRPLLSLDSSEEEEKARDFLRFLRENTGKKDGACVLEPKLDGFSVELVYELGEFSVGSTRGDGRTGEDISENLKTIPTMPLRLQNNASGLLAVRGEVLMSKEGFQELNRKRVQNGEDAFANPRNAAAGIMRQLDSRKVAGKPLQIFCYEIVDSEGQDIPASHWEVLEILAKWGFKTNPLNRLASNFSEIKDYREELMKKRKELLYEIDGVVIKLNDRESREHLGTRQRNPRWAYAWKFPPKKEVTVLRDIVVQVGRTGMLTPVALLDPVDVGGVTVSRATLHNEKEVEKKDVRPGDTVRIFRAGDVIPEVAERVKEPRKKRGKKFRMPSHCPSCGSDVVREGAYVLCPAGLSCPAQRTGRIIHYASRGAMDIETLGEKNIKQLVEKGLVKELPDLYKLSPEQLRSLEGFAEKSAKKLYNAIHGASQPPLERFLYALGIRHVGEHIAGILALHFGSLERLADAGRDELEAVEEIGPEIAESVQNFFQDKENRRILDELKRAGVKPKSAKRQKSEALKGLTFVFTGELESYTREQAEKEVESLGGRATSSVSGNTDYLVLGKGPGSKLDEAKKNDVKILDEKAFMKLLDEKKEK